MNDDYSRSGSVLENQVVPQHRPGFWTDLEATFDGSAMTETNTDTEIAPRRAERTAEMPAASPSPVDELAARRNRRRIWPMAAAAAVLAMLGIGFLATRGPADPGLSTNLVAGTPEAGDIVPLDGPEDGTGNDDTAETADTADTSTGTETSSETAETGSDDGAPAADQDSSAAADPTPAAAPLPAFDSAPGAVGEPAMFAADGGVASGSRFLANRTDFGAMTWWAIADGECDSPDYSEIRYVNGSLITQDVYEPNPTFSGDVSYFTVEGVRAAWLVSCGTQLELWVASALPSGMLEDAQLVWFGPGQSQNALMLWTGDEVSLSLLGVDGAPFSVEYDATTETTSRNGRPTRFEQEAGAIALRSTPAAVSSDGNVSYWPGISGQGAGECAGSFGRADTLWLRRVTSEAIPVWEPAITDGTLLGAVTAMALEPEFSQVAFADVCPDEDGRVFIATQQADGQLSNLREIDLSPFVPGFADALYWIDSQTLRIETDNSEYGFGTVRFDFRLDDGRDNGIIVQLD